MTNKTHAPSTPSRSTLSIEAAVAARLVRAGRMPIPLLRWLAGAERAAPSDFTEMQAQMDQRLTESMDEILRPILVESMQAEHAASRHTAQWLGAACLTASQHYRQLQLGIGPRLLAASLLPLYRCLATGKLSEGLQQSQARFADLLTLLAMCHEVGADLVAVLDTHNHRMDAPGTLLSAQFDLNLIQVSQLLCDVASDYQSTQQQFSQVSSERLWRTDSHSLALPTPAWGDPLLLWKLSGELISKNSELVLPRCWIDTPVPWSNVADHWHQLAHLLNQPSGRQPAARQSDSSGCPSLEFLPIGASESFDCEQVGDVQAESQALSAIAALSDLMRSAPPAKLPATQSTRDRQTSVGHAPQDTSTEKTEHRQSVVPTAPDLSSPDNSTSDAHAQNTAPAKTQEPTTGPVASPTALPKVLIAEIRSHNDPVFVNVIRRQIGKCRAEDRAISLVSMIVLPEDDAQRHDVHANGLTLWQQRLVNWLSDHPQVVEPHAFITSDGELLLALLDLERNETTSLVRHGLIEVLTGRQIDESQGSQLAKVELPARYHAGIASTSAPGSNFTPDQLIEPAIRCLSAASRHGKASIKSIEVY